MPSTKKLASTISLSGSCISQNNGFSSSTSTISTSGVGLYGNNIGSGLINKAIGISNGYSLTNYFTYNRHQEIINNVINIIPIILDNIVDNEIVDKNVIAKIYLQLIQGCSKLDSTSKTIDRNKILYQLAKGNKSVWIMYNKNEDDDVSIIASTLLLHCY